MTGQYDDGEDLKRAAESLQPSGACPGEERILAFYRGALDDDGADAVREHLVTCAACLDAARHAREFLAALREGESRTAAPPPRPAAGLRSRRTATWAAAAAITACAALGLYALLPERRPATGPELVWRGDDGNAELAAAMEHYRAGRFEAAEVALESYILSHPAHERARLYLAVSRMRVGRTADARRELARLAEGDDESVRAEAKRWLAELERDGAR